MNLNISPSDIARTAMSLCSEQEFFALEAAITDKFRSSRFVRGTLVILIGLISVAGGLYLSVLSGVAHISTQDVLDTLTRFNNESENHLIVWHLRIPRALAALLVGAGFAVAGAIMQGVTQNPLADPGLLGVNAGAQFMLVIVFAFLPFLPFSIVILFCFAGGGIGALLVYGVAYFAKGRMTPVKLALAGAVVSSLLIGISQAISILLQLNFQMAFWSAGGISGAEWTQVNVIIPWVIVGLLLAVYLSSYITLLNLGEEMAKGLGQRTTWIKIMAAISVFLLAGAAVSTVGSIGFIGLIVPHIVRFLLGADYRWIIPCSAIVGAAAVLWADIGAKLINAPYETPLGSIISVVGVPFFLYLARKERRELY
ncbi:FecCD family ABC transporter permease [Paenibacillus dendritiformis]|uniref:FecCD family ABC transporter permease n=1 Tax=Paenibacillus dendritiformis TaxID=130049 RepID=UPI001F0F3332|nr:iron ABC transporter permease [Paenibacillus dendritiformis]